VVAFIDVAVDFLGLQKKPPSPPTSTENKDTLTSYKSPYYSQSYDYPYNPDDLVKKKGGLEIYEKMLTDEQVKAALKLKINAIIGNGWTVEPGDDSPAAKEQADFITHCLTDGMEGSFRRNLKDMLTALAFGFSVTEINYVNLEQGPFAGKIGLKCLITRPPHSFEFPKDDKGYLLGVTQNTAKGPLKMNMDVVRSKLIVYSYDAQFGGEYGQSDLRAAYRSWWSKDIITRFMNIYLERFGTGILVGRYPRGMKKEEQQDLEAMIKNITAKTAFKVPDEIKFEVLEGKASATAIFIPVLEYYNKAISRSVLLPDKLGFTDSDGGSYNLGQNQFNLFYLLLEDIRQEFAETAINEQLVVRLIDLNYSTAIYPTFKFKPLTEKDKAAMATTFIAAVKDGVIVETEKDEEYLRDTIGFIKRDPESPIIERPAPPSPFGGPGQPPAPGSKEFADNDEVKKIKEINGIKIAIEWPKGSTRTWGKDTPRIPMKADYGFVNGTEGEDEMDIDVYLGPQTNSKRVFVVEQLKKDGTFDENKYMLGYKDIDAAKTSFAEHTKMLDVNMGEINEIAWDEWEHVIATSLKEPGIKKNMADQEGKLAIFKDDYIYVSGRLEGDPKIEVLKTMNPSQASPMFRESENKELRGFYNKNDKNYYLWDSAKLVHADMLTALKLGDPGQYRMPEHIQTFVIKKETDLEKVKEILGKPSTPEKTKPAVEHKPGDWVTINGRAVQIGEDGKAKFSDKQPRQPNKYEKAINFKQEMQDLDTFGEKYKVEAGKQIMDMKDDLLATIVRKKLIEEQNFNEVDKLDLKNLGDLKNIFGAMYRNAFATGKNHGRAEIKAKKNSAEFALKGKVSNLPPKEALAYFDRKKFTLAGTERDYILKNVKGLLYEGIKTGKPTNEVVYNIEEFFDENYSTVTELPDGEERIDETPARIETVVRTNYTDAYNQGKLASFQDESVADFIPAYEYSAILDDRTSGICTGLDGLIFNAADPIWQKIIPPNHFNCRSTIIPILSDEEYEISEYPDPADMPDRAFGG